MLSVPWASLVSLASSLLAIRVLRIQNLFSVGGDPSKLLDMFFVDSGILLPVWALRVAGRPWAGGGVLAARLRDLLSQLPEGPGSPTFRGSGTNLEDGRQVFLDLSRNTWRHFHI